jgi:LytS/YehU family sensor histidine kinase
LAYLTQYLNVERARYNDSFRYYILKSIITPENRIPVPAMLLQPILENAIRHGIRHLPDGTGVIKIEVIEEGEQIRMIITDNGIGLQKNSEIKEQTVQKPLTSSVVNTKRINILNQLFREQITISTGEVDEADNNLKGKQVIIS